jgi:hypothetical protein
MRVPYFLWKHVSRSVSLPHRGGSTTTVQKLGRLTLGLYNSYNLVQFREAHRRVIARAAPLAEAFDWNLAVFGFPFPPELGTSEKVAEWISGTTSIGDEGKYTVELSDKGRLLMFGLPAKGFPPQLGTLVVTTRKPWKERSTPVGEIARRAVAGESLLLLFGLGPKGLPPEVFELGKLHFDVTGRGKSLETCTAIGSVVGSVSTAVRYLAAKK